MTTAKSQGSWKAAVRFFLQHGLSFPGFDEGREAAFAEPVELEPGPVADEALAAVEIPRNRGNVFSQANGGVRGVLPFPVHLQGPEEAPAVVAFFGAVSPQPAFN